MTKITILELFSIYHNTINNYAHKWGIPLQTRKRSNWLETNFIGGHTIELVETRDKDNEVIGYCLTVMKQSNDKFIVVSDQLYSLLDSKYYA